MPEPSPVSLIHMGTDPRLWAESFADKAPGIGGSRISFDLDSLADWFAAAINAGYDKGYTVFASAPTPIDLAPLLNRWTTVLLDDGTSATGLLDSVLLAEKGVRLVLSNSGNYPSEPVITSLDQIVQVSA
jgi:hypothetical protein